MPSDNNKRIAKNTMLLYVRMLLSMIIQLITVRIVLKTLGVVDYGIFNVVGGIVAMFSFLSGTMSSASQRFFAFELGKNDIPKLKKTFRATMTIYILMALALVILAETIGLWFLNHKLVIPPERMSAANWVYQFSILSFVTTMLTIPYNASIIAHERMNVYAYVSIVEVVLKLVIVYLLLVFSVDKLKLYGVLIFAVTTIVTFIYRTYCQRKFEECRYRFEWDPPLLKQIMTFSGWTLFGVTARMLNNYGVNIVLNLFFGPVVNASRGIAYQISSKINQFVSNFLSAVRPQITKHYAAGDHAEFFKLIFRSSKISFFLLLIISMPVLLETEYLIMLWLDEVPEYVVIFTRLIIVAALIDSMTFPLNTASASTGDVKKYQIVVGGIMLLNLPASYLVLKMGYPPESTIVVYIIVLFICLFLRLWVLKSQMEISVGKFLKDVLGIAVLTSILSYIPMLAITYYIEEGLVRFIITLVSGGIVSLSVVYFIGMTKNERKFILDAIQQNLIKKLKSGKK